MHFYSTEGHHACPELGRRASPSRLSQPRLPVCAGQLGNVVRHGFLALKYGRDTWTPAMQAGITKRPLTFRQIFTMAGTHLAVLVLWRLWRPESSRFRKVARLTNSY